MRILFLFVAVLFSIFCNAQSTVHLRGDTIRVYKQGGNATFKVENATKDSTNGVLTNVGNGTTEFLKFRTSNDSLFLGNVFIGKLAPSEEPNLVIVTKGSSGDSSLQIRNDSVIQVLFRDSIFIKKFIAPDSSWVFYLDTALLRSWTGRVAKDSAQLVIPNQLIPFGTNGNAATSREFRYDSALNRLILRVDTAGNTTQTNFQIARQETWGSSVFNINSVSGGSSGSSRYEISASNVADIRITSLMRFSSAPYFSSNIVLDGGLIQANDGRMMSFLMGRQDGGPLPARFFGRGISVADSINTPIFQIDPEGDIFVGRRTGDAVDNPWIMAEFDAHNAKTSSLPQLTTAQMDSIGGIKYIYVSVQGSGYATPPTVTISGGGGSGATATARVAGGRIIGVDLTSKGTGYTSQPAVSVSGGGGSGAVLIARWGALEKGMKIFNTDFNAEMVYDGTRWTGTRYNGTKFQGYDGTTWIDLN